MSQSPSKADFLARSIHRDTAVGHVIETRYLGYKFRSRLEARWACLFHHLGLEFEYEPEGYIVDGKPYLPDFRVHSWNAWVECKPVTERENLVIHLDRLMCVSMSTNANAIVVCGAPDLMGGNWCARSLPVRRGISHQAAYFGESGYLRDVPNEFVTLAYRKAMEERFDGRG